jgi:hypothetical protein
MAHGRNRTRAHEQESLSTTELFNDDNEPQVSAWVAVFNTIGHSKSFTRISFASSDQVPCQNREEQQV